MNLASFLARSSGFAGFSGAELERVAAQAKTRSFSRSDQLWRPGDLAEQLVIVQRGLLKVTRWTNGGSGITTLYGPAEDVESFSVLQGLEHRSVAIALTDEVVVIVVPRAAFLELWRSRTSAAALTWATNSTLRTLDDWIDLLSAGTVEARLAYLLRSLHQRFGDEFDDGTSRIQLALSRRELSELASTSFEGAVRVLSRWERQGLLRTEPSGLTLKDSKRLFALGNRDEREARSPTRRPQLPCSQVLLTRERP